ncbi:TIGR04282 family arsenosugar biosynthesis glycosyltransferase [Aestuariivivens insulae]|uniref:TIGR04282 family arsenosugar biosynthesis glycosyltransferase n=1 Tax=Aestuariivivens insulae TaxID=1621988 RepID=UPI001F582E77|nr:TIGR04282 family arsenosugar biosynthesis glycosyltransferase [Aestuariivivens insulae]
MTKDLLIVFVKNLKLGKVKTRLAKTIGDQAAFEVYAELVKLTERATQTLAIDKRIYFSDAIIKTQWKNEFKAIQQGKDLGERMLNAFKKGFEEGYERIVLIGSDLPDISETHIKNAFAALQEVNVTFGPAEDGGYYLVGLSELHPNVFIDKPWSTSHLLDDTLLELKRNNIAYKLLEPLNDIDTFEDLKASKFYKSNLKLQEKIKQLHD